jgi:hypothetical protein
MFTNEFYSYILVAKREILESSEDIRRVIDYTPEVSVFAVHLPFPAYQYNFWIFPQGSSC